MTEATKNLAMPVARWAFPLAGLFVVGPMVGLTTAWLRTADGGLDASPLLSDAPVLGLLAAVLAVVVAAWGGIVAGRVCDIRTGLLTAGFILAWAALRSGEFGMILRAYDSGGVLLRLAVEGAVVCGAMSVAAGAIVRFSREPQMHPIRSRDAEPFKEAIKSSSTLVAIGVGCVAALGVAWLVARTDAKGQTILAALAAGIAAAAAGKVATASMEVEPPLEAYFVSILLASIVSPIVAVVMHGSSVEYDQFAGRLFAPAMILPLDWAAGALIGVPIGARWGQGSIDRKLAKA